MYERLGSRPIHVNPALNNCMFRGCHQSIRGENPGALEFFSGCLKNIQSTLIESLENTALRRTCDGNTKIPNRQQTSGGDSFWFLGSITMHEICLFDKCLATVQYSFWLGGWSKTYTQNKKMNSCAAYPHTVFFLGMLMCSFNDMMRQSLDKSRHILVHDSDNSHFFCRFGLCQSNLQAICIVIPTQNRKNMKKKQHAV